MQNERDARRDAFRAAYPEIAEVVDDCRRKGYGINRLTIYALDENDEPTGEVIHGLMPELEQGCFEITVGEHHVRDWKSRSAPQARRKR